jgi:hypothetical protein
MVAGRRNQSFFSVNRFRKPCNHPNLRFSLFKDIENSSPTPRSTPIRGQIISGLRRDSGRTRMRAILFASEVEVPLVCHAQF